MNSSKKIAWFIIGFIFLFNIIEFISDFSYAYDSEESTGFNEYEVLLDNEDDTQSIIYLVSR